MDASCQINKYAQNYPLSTFECLDTDSFKKQSFSKTRGPKISQTLLKILHLQKSTQI